MGFFIFQLPFPIFWAKQKSWISKILCQIPEIPMKMHLFRKCFCFPIFHFPSPGAKKNIFIHQEKCFCVFVFNFHFPFSGGSKKGLFGINSRKCFLFMKKMFFSE